MDLQSATCADGVKSVENEKQCSFPHVPNADSWKHIYGLLGSLRCACRRQHSHVKATQAMRRVKQNAKSVQTPHQEVCLQEDAQRREGTRELLL